MRRLFAGLVAATALLFVVSSVALAAEVLDDGPGTTVAAGSPGSPATTAPPTAARPSSGSGDGITVLDAGAEPRLPLRSHPRAGSVQRVATETRISLDVSADGETVTVPASPALRMVLARRVDAVDPDGTAHVTVTYERVRVADGPALDPEVRAAMTDVAADLEGLKGTITVTDRGEVLDSRFAPGQVDDPVGGRIVDSLSSQADSLSMPFPEEPVGVGARWTRRSTATILGIRMESVSTVTLTARAGDTYELSYHDEDTADPQDLDLEALLGGAVDEGTEVRFSQFAVRSDGSVRGSLADVVPVGSRLAGGGDLVIRITDGGTTDRIRMHMDLEVTSSPA